MAGCLSTWGTSYIRHIRFIHHSPPKPPAHDTRSRNHDSSFADHSACRSPWRRWFPFSTAHRAAADGHLLAAAEVVDRETLKDFVLGAKGLVESAGNEEELETVLEELRSDEWKEGSIYIFITGYDGTSFFHGAVPAREGTNNIDQEDSNGVMVVQELIAAAKSGGGFVEYLWDNPAIEGAGRIPQGQLRRSRRDPGGELLHRRRVVSIRGRNQRRPELVGPVERADLKFDLGREPLALGDRAKRDGEPVSEGRFLIVGAAPCGSPGMPPAGIE